MKIDKEVKKLKKEIDLLLGKAQCSNCGKTLFMYDDTFIYIKCKHCKEINCYNKKETLDVR